MRAELREFRLGGLRFRAVQCVDGVLVNPVLPRMFDQTPNELRPAAHRKWWHRPFIVTEGVEALDVWYASRTDEYAEKGRREWQESGRAVWMNAWPSGVRYTVRCLDGGAWDRSTNWGSFATLEQALARAGASGDIASETP